MEIEGKAALVTGGASGLGAATVHELVGRGASVVICDLNEQAGKQLASEFGDGAHFVPTDVTEEADVSRAVDLAVRKLGALHIAVSCAGTLIAEKVIGKNGPHDLSRFRKVIDTNLVGTFNVLRLSAERIGKMFAPLYTLFSRKYWFDEFYEDGIVRKFLLGGLFGGLQFFDSKGVDGLVNGVAHTTFAGGRAIRRAQTGQLQLYGIAIGVGILVIILSLYFGG